MNTIVLDIETVAIPVPSATIADWRAELSEEFKKDETIAAKLAARIDKAKFDFDGCRPVAIAARVLCSDGKEVLFSQSGRESQSLVDSFLLFASAFTHGPTRISGYNIKRFDLPILAPYFAGSVCAALPPFGRYDVIDLMDYVAGFGRFVSLERACNAYRIETSESDGSMVAGWYADGQLAKIESYCVEDVTATRRLYRALSRVHKF